MKKPAFAAGILIFLLFLGSASASGPNIKVFLDNRELSFDVAPMVVNERTMVPLRAIGEALEAKVEWDPLDQKITVTKGGTVNILFLGDSAAQKIVNGKTEILQLDAPPFAVEGRTMVPLRYLSESFDMDVTWDGPSQSVFIVTHPAGIGFSNPKIDFSQDAAGQLLALHSNIRYAFEQYELPQALFEEEEQILSALKSQPDSILNSIAYAWQTAADSVLIQAMTDSDLSYAIESEEELYLLLDALYEEFQLFTSDVMDILVGNSETLGHVIMIQYAPLDVPSICTYAAILSDGEHLRYFTLETSLDQYYMLCEITPSGRINYGLIQNSWETFFDRILEIVEKGN